MKMSLTPLVSFAVKVAPDENATMPLEIAVGSPPLVTVVSWLDERSCTRTVVPLVNEIEASRSRQDVVVVSLPLTFNYALATPQPFTTKVSDRYATHFTPTVHGVNAMNWVDYARPIAELRARLRRTRDVWLLDTPEIINALGPAPRHELTTHGFARQRRSRNGYVVLEHWKRT